MIERRKPRTDKTVRGFFFAINVESLEETVVKKIFPDR